MADHVHLHEIFGPARPHVIGVVMGGVANVRNIGLAVDDLVGDAHRLAPGFGFGDAERPAVAGEGELAGIVAPAVLKDDAADGRRIEAAGDAVQDDLGNRSLALSGSLRASK